MFLVLYSTAFADGKKSENKDNQKNNNLIWEKVKTHEKDHKSEIEWEKFNDQIDFLLNNKGINNSINSFFYVKSKAN